MLISVGLTGYSTTLMLSMDPHIQSLRNRLLARIHRRFKTVTETHALGPLRLPFVRIADPDSVLDQIVEAEDRREKLSGERRDGDELHLPYWAELWDSAIGVGTYLASVADLRIANCDLRLDGMTNRKSQIKNRKSILDLGCGMGLTSMVAAAMGARVLMADLEPDALLFARLNTLPWYKQVRTRRVNWRTDRLEETFDLIIGADVLYDRKQWEHLEAFFRHHLSPGGFVLLGEPGRQTGDLFPEWVETLGWRITMIEQPVPMRSRPIRVLRLTQDRSA